MGTGGIKCWGKNNYGQLGNGTTINQSTPVDVIGISNAVDIWASGSRSCAVLDNGSVKCWGPDVDGINTVPVEVDGISNAVQWSSSCAVLGDGKIKCGLPTPVEVPGISNAVEVSGGSTSCARLATGGLRCWGANYAGQFGNGTKTAIYETVLIPVVAFGMQ